jgi:hypothetical protein
VCPSGSICKAVSWFFWVWHHSYWMTRSFDSLVPFTLNACHHSPGNNTVTHNHYGPRVFQHVPQGVYAQRQRLRTCRTSYLHSFPCYSLFLSLQNWVLVGIEEFIFYSSKTPKERIQLSIKHEIIRLRSIVPKVPGSAALKLEYICILITTVPKCLGLDNI